MAQSLQHFGRGALRVAKNYTKGYSDTQTKVRESTSNDPWGPSGTQMNEIAQLTYNQGDFVEIMEMLDKRLNDKGKNWRHVFKALTLLDYLLHAGSENVVIYFKDNLYIVKTLKEFVYVDDQGKDVGHNVRQKAKDITNLLQDEERLRAERRQRGAMRDRMLGNIADSGLRGEEDYGGPRSPGTERPPPREAPRPHRTRDEDDDLQRALQESMATTEDDERRRSQRQKEEDDLAKAIRLSEEEDAKRKRELEESNARALMDDNLQLNSNNQYSQQQQQQQQQPMNTGFPLVDVGPGWNQPMQPQYTSFNPFHQQMLQQQQQEEFMRQQMMQQQQAQQEEYMRQQQMLQQQQQLQAQQTSLLAQPTGYGSNNPFAPRPTGQQQQSLFDSSSSQPTSSFLPVPSMSSFSNPSNNTPSSPPRTNSPPALSNTISPNPATQRPTRQDDGQHAGLANLLARGREDGLDTFGNIGNLRIPTGQPFHQSNRMAVQQTGLGANNPFQRPQNNDQPFFQI